MYRDCKKSVCPDCDKAFTYSSQLNTHRRIHTGEKLFVFPDCDTKFTQSGELSMHCRMHTGEEPFACPDCDKQFTNSSSVIRHRRIHTGVKPFACPDCVCDKKFTRNDKLNEHRKIHTGEKPFACPDCDKKFTRSNALNVHRRIHTGEKPFACPDCDKNFTRSDKLNVHRRIHTGEEKQQKQQQLLHRIETLFVCHVCEEPFSEESLLENHVKIHPDAEDFLCERNFANFMEQRKLSLGLQMPVHTDDVSIVPSVCSMICSASSGNCVLDLKVEDGGGQFGHVTTDEPSVSLIGSSNHESDLFRSSPDVPVPSGSNDNRVMCSGDCLEVKDELVDIDVHAGYSLVSGGSLKVEDEADSFKLYGCGICCQSFSTKEETMQCFNSH